MLRKILAILLVETMIGITVSAQVPVNKPIVAKQASDSSAEVESSVVYRESKVRAGHDTELAIVAGTQAMNCLDCLPTLGNSEERLFIETTVLEPTPGFSFRYADQWGEKFKATPSRKYNLTKAGPASLLKIHADKKLKTGEYQLRGKVTFTIIHFMQMNEKKEINLTIPISVVAGNETVALNAWPYEVFPDHHVRDQVLFIVLLPIEIPYALALEFYCDLSSHCE